MDNNWPPKEWTEEDLKRFELENTPRDARTFLGTYNSFVPTGKEWKQGHEGYDKPMNHFQINRMTESLVKYARKTGMLENVKRIIDEACKKNGGLPF